MELIDKNKLLEELKKLKQNLSASPIVVIEDVESLVESLDVKEVDLEEEIDKWYDTAPDEFEKIHFEHIENCAKHFFELGLKAREGKK